MIGKLIAVPQLFSEDSCAAVMEFDMAPDIHCDTQLIAHARAAVEQYMTTPEAKQVAEEFGAFNWGDAFVNVPEDIWVAHGLTPVKEGPYLVALVDHDEDFADRGEGLA